MPSVVGLRIITMRTSLPWRHVLWRCLSYLGSLLPSWRLSFVRSPPMLAQGRLVPSVADLLFPLLSKVGRLHTLVDNHVHLRRPAGMTGGRQNVFCTPADCECTRANREILTEVRREADRAAQHSRACHELLSSGLQSFPSIRPPVGTVGGDGFPMSKNAWKRYNRRKQQLFRQKEKARRVELAMRAAGVALGPSFLNREGAWWL